MEGISVHGDYVELNGVDRGTDVLAVLVELLKPLAVHGGSRSFPVLTLAGDTEMFVDELGDGCTLLAIAATGVDSGQRRESAARVYNALHERTTWALSWTADDATGTIAIRAAEPSSDRQTSSAV